MKLTNSKFHNQNLMNWLNNLCRPNPKYIQDKFLQELAVSRAKTLLALQGLIIMAYIVKFVENEHRRAECVVGIVLCILTAAFRIYSCRVHPEIFNIVYNLMMAVFGPVHLEHEETEHFSWSGTQTYPVVILLVTGSIFHCLLQCGFQTIMLKVLYEPRIIEILMSKSPVKFGKDFSHSLMLFTPSVVVLFIVMQITLINAYAKIIVIEKKKEEIERQKVFLLGFSHELRNLINSIMGNINLAVLEANWKTKHLLTNAEFCGKLLLHLVNNILDTGKAEIGDLEINLSPTKVYDTMENIWSICSELIKRKNLKGTMTMQKNIPQTLNLDHYRLTQIFMNLIGNAVKYTDTGAISINVEWIPDTSKVNYECFQPIPFNNDSEFDEGIFEKCRQFSIFDKNCFELDLAHRKIDNKVLTSDLNCKKGILKVSVSDTGNGIEAEDIHKLFEKFTQVSSDSSKRKLGTGLGLFITKELCNKMKGEIKAFSRIHEGTCFIFCLPVEVPLELKSQAQSIHTSLPENSLSAMKLKAMIVDDLEFCRDILENYLKKLDAEVVQTAVNGSDAYQKFVEMKNKKQTLNIITLDLDMPVMNGQGSARLIREFEAKRGLKPCFIIIVSGNCGQAEIEECLDQNGTIRANVFLKKPVSMNDISRVISDCIRSK